MKWFTRSTNLASERSVLYAFLMGLLCETIAGQGDLEAKLAKVRS